MSRYLPAISFPSSCSESEYASVGIKVVTHIFAFDEFWWKGESIGPDNANAVFEFKTEKGMMPGSVDEALRYKKAHADRRRVHMAKPNGYLCSDDE